MIGPNTAANPNTAPRKPVHKGAQDSGTTLANIRITPALIPDAPMPETARPIIKTVDDGAAPQIADPTLKRRTLMRNIHLGE